MNILELKTTQMNKAVAYILGLIFPLYKENNVLGKECILGCVNHNPGRITPEALDEHLRSIRSLLDSFENTKGIRLFDNKIYNIQRKQGFSVTIEKQNISTEECLEIISAKVEEIQNGSMEIQKEFIKGCFDGRSSWDTKAHYLSIDVDRDYARQDMIVSMIEKTGIKINVNRREKNHPKNDQLRIKHNSLGLFLSNIGMYSTYRKKQIYEGLGLLNIDIFNCKNKTRKN